MSSVSNSILSIRSARAYLPYRPFGVLRVRQSSPSAGVGREMPGKLYHHPAQPDMVYRLRGVDEHSVLPAPS